MGAVWIFLFLFSHRKCQNSADLEMYYLSAETKCYLTPAVTGPNSESLRSLTKPLAQGITDGSLSHGKDSTHPETPFSLLWNRKYHPRLAPSLVWILEGGACLRDRDYPRDSALLWGEAMIWAPGRLRGQGQAQRDKMDAGASLQEFSQLLSCVHGAEPSAPGWAQWINRELIPALTNPPLSLLESCKQSSGQTPGATGGVDAGLYGLAPAGAGEIHLSDVVFQLLVQREGNVQPRTQGLGVQQDWASGFAQNGRKANKHNQQMETLRWKGTQWLFI